MANWGALAPLVWLTAALYFNGVFLALLYFGEVILLIYKGFVLPYPARNFWSELVLLTVCLGLDAVRLFMGAKGSLTARKIPLVVSLAFVLPIIFGYLYFVLWQTYVFTVELVLYITAYIGLGVQICLSPIVYWNMHRND